MIIRFTGENFEQHWGFIECQDKIILDIGADYGSTAECFLAYGAKKIIAVEGEDKLYNQLTEYSRDKPVIPIKKWINKTEDFIYLFQLFQSINEINETNSNSIQPIQQTSAKIDCEGAEIYLLDVPDHLLEYVDEYAIECHSNKILNDIVRKFENIGFEILGTVNLVNDISTVHIRKIDIGNNNHPNNNHPTNNYSNNYSIYQKIDQTIKYITVVNNFDILNKALLQSSELNQNNNPNPINSNNIPSNIIIVDNTEENKPISYRYNRVIDELLQNPYDQNISWLVFCHQDFYIGENLSLRLNNLDKNYIYGPIGISQNHKELFGRILQTNGEYLGTYCNRCDIDNLDAMCLIVHRDTVRDRYLRFDEKYEFHFYVESFCQNAKYKGIETKTLQMKCQHRSKTLTGDKDTQAYKDSRNIWIDNFGDIRTTTYSPQEIENRNIAIIGIAGISISIGYLLYKNSKRKEK